MRRQVGGSGYYIGSTPSYRKEYWRTIRMVIGVATVTFFALVTILVYALEPTPASARYQNDYPKTKSRPR